MNFENPEANGHLTIHAFTDHDVNGRRINGVGMMFFPPSQKDVESNLYKMTIHPSKNAVLLSMPSLHYVLRKKSKTYQAVSKKAKGYVDRHELEVESNRIAVSDDPSRQFKKVLFVFPDSYLITNKIYTKFAADAEGEEVEYEPVPVPNDKTKTNTTPVLKWFVALDEPTPRYYQSQGKAQSKGKDKMAEATKMLAGMMIDDDEDDE